MDLVFPFWVPETVYFPLVPGPMGCTGSMVAIPVYVGNLLHYDNLYNYSSKHPTLNMSKKILADTDALRAD